MGKRNKSGVKKAYRFLTPAFNHKGVSYIASDLEALVNAGDENALQVFAELQALGHVVEVEVEVTTEEKEGGSDE